MKQFNLTHWFSQYRGARVEARARRLATLDERWGLPIWGWLLLLLTIGAVVRYIAYRYAVGFFHADEIGQYLEPAHRLLEHHGVVAWEFKDGGRNWFVAWHYAAVLKFAHWLGLSGLGQFRFARLHAAMLSLVVIPAAFRIGRALSNRWEGAVLAAAAVALSPALGYLSCRVIAEGHCMLFITWAYALWCEQAVSERGPSSRYQAVVIGLLLGAAFVARPNYGIVIPLVLADVIVRRRFRDFWEIVGGLALPVVALGVADWVCWGAPFKSVFVWIHYNIIEGKGAARNAKPFPFYFRDVLFRDYGPILFVMLTAMVVSIRTTWRAVLAWLFPVVVLSVLTNKQERFILPIWPCFLATASASLVEARRVASRHVAKVYALTVTRYVWFALPTLVILFALMNSLSAVRSRNWSRGADLFRAHGWVGRQKNLTGLASDSSWFRTGAYTVVDRHVPIVFSQTTPPSARIFSHYVATGDAAKRVEKSKDWKVVKKFGKVYVLQRRNASTSQPSSSL
jgi:hypothetical protein